jgi:hypothetical protein
LIFSHELRYIRRFGGGWHMERWEFDHSEEPRGWRWLRVDTETQYVSRCCDRYFSTLRECVEDAVVHGYVVPVKPRDGGTVTPSGAA